MTNTTRQIRLTAQQQATLLAIDTADLRWFAEHPRETAFDRQPYPDEIALAEKLKQIKPQATNKITVMMQDNGKIIRGYITE